MKILYSVRSKYGNKYDYKLILLLGYINIEKEFNINLKELECINFPGDNTIQLGFPNNLKSYFEIMKLNLKMEIRKYDKLIELNQYDISNKEKYSNFINDFQPWSRMINTFLNIYSDKKIPSIEDISKYGDFIANKNVLLKEFDFIKDAFVILFLDRINNNLKLTTSLSKNKKPNLNNNKNLIVKILNNNPKKTAKNLKNSKNIKSKNIPRSYIGVKLAKKNNKLLKTRKKLIS